MPGMLALGAIYPVLFFNVLDLPSQRGNPLALGNIHDDQLPESVEMGQSIHHFAVSSRLVPKRKFNAIPQPKLVVDDAKVILDDHLCSTDDLGHLAILESLRDEFDDSQLRLVKVAASIALSPTHSWLQALSPDSDAASRDCVFPHSNPVPRNSRARTSGSPVVLSQRGR